MSAPDEYWVDKARQDPEAFAELVHRYQERIYHLTYRMIGKADDAEDLTQETFVRCYSALGSFRMGARFAPWLYRIAVNLCLNYRQRRRWPLPLPESPEAGPQQPSLEDTVLQREREREVQRALRHLPEVYRAVLILRHYQGLSYEEIAEALGVPLGTVKTRLFRAREMLLARLTPEEVPVP